MIFERNYSLTRGPFAQVRARSGDQFWAGSPIRALYADLSGRPRHLAAGAATKPGAIINYTLFTCRPRARAERRHYWHRIKLER